MFRFVFNSALTGVLLIVGSLIGWLTLLSDGVPVTSWSWPVVGAALIAGVVFSLVRIAFGWVLLITGIASGGIILLLALLLFPFIGWVLLAITAAVAPNLIVLHGFWISVLSGYILMAVRVPKQKSVQK